MKTLLIEIGAEEIPAGYIVPALEAFEASVLAALGQARISHGKARTYGTPRRLALMVESVAPEQAAQTSTLTGPPERVGFDSEGKPTIAAEKFAQKAGVSLSDVTVEETPKGRYLTATVTESCQSTRAILEAGLEKLILAIPFPKQMRWGDLSISFARPIISLTGMLGEQVLDFTVGDIRSSNTILGHSFMAPDPVVLETAEDYVSTAESCGVIPEIEKRKKLLDKAVRDCAAENDAVILEDEALLDIVTNLVESPFPVVGSFDRDFLEVPDEVLITAMREHQKYFALTDEQGRLKPLFIAVNNTRARDLSLVTRGHEKVLRARLSDAKFFYETDLKSSLDEFAEKLKQVTFQEKLGSVHDKSVRIEQLGAFLVSLFSGSDQSDLSEDVARAARICKADLVSQVVIEFTKLQGVIGRAYALKAGEKEAVAQAVEQHYRPTHSGGSLPENPVAAILAVSDKMDTLCGCFSVGLIPTGGADPYALRRQGIGILQILMDGGYSAPLSAMVEKGLAPFIGEAALRSQTALAIMDFLKNRMRNMLSDAGLAKEAVNSALSAAFDNIPDVRLRARALDELRKEADFEPLSVTFKRVENIIRKAGADSIKAVNPALFEEDSETALFKAVEGVTGEVAAAVDGSDYPGALAAIAQLRPVVDSFFDDVMVMAEDPGLRGNRIALLASVSGLFSNIGDFSQI